MEDGVPYLGKEFEDICTTAGAMIGGSYALKYRYEYLSRDVGDVDLILPVDATLNLGLAVMLELYFEDVIWYTDSGRYSNYVIIGKATYCTPEGLAIPCHILRSSSYGVQYPYQPIEQILQAKIELAEQGGELNKHEIDLDDIEILHKQKQVDR